MLLKILARKNAADRWELIDSGYFRTAEALMEARKLEVKHARSQGYREFTVVESDD